MSLGLACAQCAAFWGASWYFNPRRWDTVDGYVPFPVLWDGWRTMQSVSAWQRMQLTQAVALAQPVHEGQLTDRQRLHDQEHRTAFPPEA